jgi:DNA polymerase III delta prime subunit
VARNPLPIPTTPQTPEDWQHRIWEALDAFSPGAPIDDLNLLAGRTRQVARLLDIVMQRGQHAILYGERGVGKSSLANTFSVKLLGGVRTLTFVRVNCDPSDNFSRLWRKVFRRLSTNGESLSDKYSDIIYPDDIVLEMSGFSLNTTPIIIFDEFDRLTDLEARMLMANTIKNLSGEPIRATIIIVGVADSVGDLIEDHESISRCLRQVPMHRMQPSELRQIITDRLPSLGMDIQQDALAYIAALSRGLPHYTHLFGQRAARKALEGNILIINNSHVEAAMPDCIEDVDQTVREQYHVATISPRAGNIYKEVLLAAALAPVDDLGYFAPAALQQALSTILNRPAKVSLFGQHLKILCDPNHGNMLEQVGTDRRYRYRFADPMMQPFILMNGIRDRLVTREQVEKLAASYYEPKFSIEF